MINCLSPLISFNHKAPRTMKASMLRVSGRLSSQSQSQSNHWQKIIESLDKLLKILQDNHVCVSLFPYDSLVLICWMSVHRCLVNPQVPPVLAQKIFTQIFSYINVQLFNRCTYFSVS
jgi:myosin V